MIFSEACAICFPKAGNYLFSSLPCQFIISGFLHLQAKLLDLVQQFRAFLLCGKKKWANQVLPNGSQLTKIRASLSGSDTALRAFNRILKHQQLNHRDKA